MKNLFVTLMVLLVPFAVFAGQGEKPPKAPKSKILKTQWVQSLKSGGSKKKYFPEVGAPVVDERAVYVGTHSGIVYALNRSNKGRKIWTFESDGPIAAQPNIDNENVYVGNNKGMVYSINKDNGQLQWKKYVGGEVLSQITLDAHRIYVVTTSREVYCLNKSNGSEVWNQYIKGFERRFTIRGSSSVVLDGGSGYVGFADGQLVKLSTSTGSILWSKNLSDYTASLRDIDTGILIDGSSLYVSGYFGHLIRMDKGSGRVVWKKDYATGVKMDVNNDSLFLTTTDGHVLGLNKVTGHRKWDITLNSGALSPPQVVGSYLIVGAELGKAYLLDASTGKLRQAFPLSAGFYGSAVENGGSIFLLSGNSKLVALKI